MTVSPRDREAVHEWLIGQMGAERARTLMELLPYSSTRPLWRVTDPGESFWVQHGTGFFIGEAVGTWMVLLLVLLARL